MHSIHSSRPIISTKYCINISSFKLFVVYQPHSSSIANLFTEFESLLKLQIAFNIDLFLLEILIFILRI